MVSEIKHGHTAAPAEAIHILHMQYCRRSTAKRRGKQRLLNRKTSETEISIFFNYHQPCKHDREELST